MKWPALFLLAAGLLGSGAWAATAPAAFKEGVNYVPVVPAQPVSVNPGQIEVLEFFWFGDPRCYALETQLAAWQKSQPSNVILVRVPAALNPQWDLAARAYYTALQLGLADRARTVIYTALQVQHLNLGSQADFENLFRTQLGVDPAQFEKVWNSYAVDAGISQAKVLAQRYGVSNVPTFAVNGKWLTGASYRLSDAQLVALMTTLVQQQQGDIPAAAGE